MDAAQKIRLRMCRAQLIALFESLPHSARVNKSFADDFTSIQREVGGLLNIDVSNVADFKQYNALDGAEVYTEDVSSRARQLIAILNVVFEETDPIEGSLIARARDDDIRKRCADILNSGEAVDRAINQATLVLEDKVRKFSGLNEEVGQSLFSKAINSDPANAVIRISSDKELQSGYADICRGLIKVYRNPTHHHIRDSYTRVEAEAICVFIDHLLDVIKKSVVK